jgi:hypothetical protein
MRDLRELNKYRTSPSVPTEEEPYGGYFMVSIQGRTLRVVASNDAGWDHVSVSLPNRCPTWLEMDAVKRLFFEPHELCWQYNMPVSDHINIHPYVLHIWRKHDFNMPVPPKIMV